MSLLKTLTQEEATGEVAVGYAHTQAGLGRRHDVVRISS